MGSKNADNPFETRAAAYDAWYDANATVFQAEVAALRAVMPAFRGAWVEIGVGSGRFAQALGIQRGVEPAQAMSELARERGIDVVQGTAEAIPLTSNTLDTVFVITTLCFLKDLDRAFGEIARVLKPGGDLVLGHLPADSELGKLLAETGGDDPFFAHARLWTRKEVASALEASGFDLVAARYTLTGAPLTLGACPHRVLEGADRGSFVVLRAQSPS